MKDEQFLDLRFRLVEARGRLLLAINNIHNPQMNMPDVVANLATIVGHLGHTLLRVQSQVYGVGEG